MRRMYLATIFAMFAACSSFESNPEADAGTDAMPPIDATPDESAPIDAGGDIVDAGPVLEVVKENQTGVEKLVSNGTHLLWAVADGNASVRACALPACAENREIATQQETITGLALGIFDGNVNAFWSTSTKVLRRTYGNAGTTEVGTIAPSITGLARFEGRTVWSTQGKLYRCPDVAPDASPCTPNEASGATQLHALFGDTQGSEVWVADTNDIRRAPINSGGMVAFRNQTGVRSIVVDSLRVYWTVTLTNGGEVRSVPKGVPQDTPTTHVTGNEPFELVANTASVFVSMRESGDVLRIDKSGGTISTVAHVSAPRDLALAGSYLYIAASGDNRIVRVKIAP